MTYKPQTKPPLTNTLYPDLKIKSRNLVFPYLHLLKDGTKCFVLSVAVRIAKIIVTMINMFYPTTSPTYLMITY